MTFDEVLEQVRELLQSKGRVAYRALKRRFELDDEYLEDLKAELIDAAQVARDENGKVLVWVGEEARAKNKEEVKSKARQLSAAPGSHLPASRAEGERRQLTVMFIDLVGSTTLSQQLDPEDYHARVVTYQTACQQIITRYEGHIAQYLGDGVLVYFGYPAAHDEDAVRAGRSGLEVVAAVGQLEFTPPLQVRIGIHTGPVVVGEIGSGAHAERLALGETPNIAARVQGQAEPDTVVVSAATYRLVYGLFESQDLGLQTLKGIATPLSLYRIIGESAAQSRFEVALSTGLTPFIGRDPELGVLRQHWEQARAGDGQVVLLSGEPGIGKSRLVQEFKEQLGRDGVTRLEFRCSPYHQNSALYPIIDHLQRLLQFAREDTPAIKLGKLQHTLSLYRFPQTDTLPLLAALLSLPHPEGYPPITVSPQKQKEKTQAALVAWLIEEAAQSTVYNAWEDLHWADPSTLEVLTLLLDQGPTTRLLAVLTFRPEFVPPWRNRSHLSQLTLRRLGKPQVEIMVEKVTGGKTLPQEVMQQIVSKTDGVPLFVEELTKTVVESGLVRGEGDRYVGAHGDAPIPPLAIPSTLQDTLMARLDRLAPVKELAQLGATLGRAFSYELLHAVSPLDEGSLQQGLRQLVEVELLHQRGLPPHATYLFKHALIQDTAYHSLLKSKRQHYHQQIAYVLAEQFPDIKGTQPELVAHHYTEAGLAEQAIPYWQRAGQRATQRSAYVEAISHLTKGLELLKALPDSPERTQQELALQAALGAALVAVKGYTAPEVEKTYTRARELCQQLGETPQLFPVLYRLVVFYMNRVELQTPHQLAEQGLHLAQSVQDQSVLSLAHTVLGWTLYYLGNLTSARTHLEQAIALYDSPTHPRPIGTEDPRVDCFSYTSWTLWYLGYPDQALKRSHEAVALAAGRSYPFTLAIALGFAAWFHLLRREGQIARERAEAVITLSTEQGFSYWLAYGTLRRGGALILQEQVEEGIAQMQQGLSTYRAMGAELGLTWALAMLAEAHGKEGQTKEGLAMLAEALARVDKTGERFYEAELYRLKGELLLTQEIKRQSSKGKNQKFENPEPKTQIPKPQPEAEACFLKAIAIAKTQQAKSLELRAAMSLVRLRQQQVTQPVTRSAQHVTRGKLAEAHQMLSEVYHWFTEGFDTLDLKEAKALLESL